TQKRLTPQGDTPSHVSILLLRMQGSQSRRRPQLQACLAQYLPDASLSFKEINPEELAIGADSLPVEGLVHDLLALPRVGHPPTAAHPEGDGNAGDAVDLADAVLDAARGHTNLEQLR